MYVNSTGSGRLRDTPAHQGLEKLQGASVQSCKPTVHLRELVKLLESLSLPRKSSFSCLFTIVLYDTVD